MVNFDKITDIFCLADEFCQQFMPFLQKHSLGNISKRPPTLSKSEIITTMVIFHLGGFRCFKHFYIYHVQKHMRPELPNTVSLNRFTELMQSNTLPPAMFLKTCRMGNRTGIPSVGPTAVRACKDKRIKRNKVFRGLAQVGKSTMGWPYGLKLHLVINGRGEILSLSIAPANVDDREPLKSEGFLRGIYGKLFGDKGYMSKQPAETLFVDGIHLIAQLRGNMKNSLTALSDKINLRKRPIIETVDDELKNMCQIEHSRHRSIGDFFASTIAGLIAYSFFPEKPSLRYQNALVTNQVRAFWLIELRLIAQTNYFNPLAIFNCHLLITIRQI